MTAANRKRCIARTIHKYEGTTLDLGRQDRGNWTSGVIGQGVLKGTKYGIAAHVYPNVDIANLTEAQAIAIYERDYWPKVAGDLLPVGADFTEWDVCVNSGAGRALQLAAKALGLSKGNATDVAKAVIASGDTAGFIKKANAHRRAFLIGLRNATYEKGWLRRVADCEATSLAWHYEDVKGAEAAKAELTKEAAAADSEKKANAGSAGAGGTVGTATTVHATQQAFDWMVALQYGLVVGIILLTAYFAYKAAVHRQRARAMREALSEVGATP